MCSMRRAEGTARSCCNSHGEVAGQILAKHSHFTMFVTFRQCICSYFTACSRGALFYFSLSEILALVVV